jgi:type I restriction enzyme, S subunit
VDEIAVHQRIIDGARQVVENWKYDIQDKYLDVLDQGTTVKDFITIQGGYAFKSDWYTKDGIRLLRNANIGHGNVVWDDIVRLPEERRQEFKDFELCEGDILITLDRPIISTGLKIALVKKEDIPSLLVQRVGRAVLTSKELLPQYFWAWLNSPYFLSAIDPGRSITVPHISPKEIESIPFAPPSLDIQREIVARIERERSLVEGNRELIKIYEEKIKKVIERVWEG